MRALTVVVLVYWVVFSDGTPALSRESSSASKFIGINFSDLFQWKPKWMIFPDSPPTTSTTHTTHVTTRAADQPLIIGRRPNEDRSRLNEGRRAGETGSEAKPQNERVAIVFNGPTTTSPTPTTKATSSFPDTDYDGRVIYPDHRASVAPFTSSCTANQTSSTVDVGLHVNLIECSLEMGVIMINGSCERLLAKGICAEGEWLVKVGDGAECVPRPCPFGQLQYNDECINSSDQDVCRRGQMLFVDMDGETYCDCEPNFVYDPISGNCYSEFEQGPCDVGNFLNITEACTVECVPNRCMLDSFVWDSASHSCYKKMYYGFCDKSMLSFRFDQGNYTLECEELINVRNIFDVATLRSCPSGSLRDYVGKCRETFRIPTFTSMPTLDNGCPPGFKKDPRGTCRRTHNLFG